MIKSPQVHHHKSTNIPTVLYVTPKYLKYPYGTWKYPIDTKSTPQITKSTLLIHKISHVVPKTSRWVPNVPPWSPKINPMELKSTTMVHKSTPWYSKWGKMSGENFVEKNKFHGKNKYIFKVGVA